MKKRERVKREQPDNKGKMKGRTNKVEGGKCREGGSRRHMEERWRKKTGGRKNGGKWKEKKNTKEVG